MLSCVVSSKRRPTECALGTGVQRCALPICTVISIPSTMSKNDPVRRQGYHLLHGSAQPSSIPPISQPHVARHSAKRIKRAAKPDEPPHPTRDDLVGFEILDQVEIGRAHV